MPSSALARWQRTRATELDGLEAVHRALRRTTVTHGMIRSWRSACDTLAVSFDTVVGRYAATITNTAPW
jgi:hypothetical protein